MAETEVFFEYPNDQYNQGIIVEEFNDRISLVLAQKPKGNGTIYKKWCFPQTKDRQPTEKPIPWKIFIGHDRQSAIEMLRRIAIHLKGDGPNP